MYLIKIKINNLQYVILGKISIIVSFFTLDKLRNYIIIDKPKFKPFITYILWFLLFKEDRSESRCTQTSMRLTKHGNFDMILIIVMENNDCKGKKTKHSINILFKEPKKDKKMLCSKFENRILHQMKSVLAHALRKMDLKDWIQQYLNFIYSLLSNHTIFHLNYEELETWIL